MAIINYRISKNVIKRTDNKITRLSYTAEVPQHFLKRYKVQSSTNRYSDEEHICPFEVLIFFKNKHPT